MTGHQALSHHPAARISHLRHGTHGMVRFVLDRYLLLPLGAVIAIVWANTAAESYFRLAHALAFPVNRIGMALLLGLLVHEVAEALMPGGSLHTWRRWGVALAAAGGGLAGSTLTYLAFVTVKHEQVLTQAWPIAGAIDLIAGYYVVKALLPRSSAVPFLLLVAVLTDAAGLLLLATWPSLTPAHVGGAGLVIAALVVAAAMRRSGVRTIWAYLGCAGVLSWIGFSLAGVHSALALLPIVPFLPRHPKRVDMFAAPTDDEAHHAEYEWNEIVQLVAFLFGLVNAGAEVRHYDTGTWAVLVGSLVGRPAGMFAAVALALAAGLRLPARLGWRELLVVACAMSSGFTVGLFFATAFLPIGGVLAQIKIGVLTSAIGAFAAVGAARATRVGRFARSSA
ncbi:MAG: hypothetical protein AB7Q29_04045 [Vicinamibacterales bacterium]